MFNWDRDTYYSFVSCISKSKYKFEQFANSCIAKVDTVESTDFDGKMLASPINIDYYCNNFGFHYSRLNWLIKSYYVEKLILALLNEGDQLIEIFSL